MLVVLNSRDAVDAFASTAQMSLGTEIGMAVGPFGRFAETVIGDGGASAVFSYAHSKGLFAGVALAARRARAAGLQREFFVRGPRGRRHLVRRRRAAPRGAAALRRARRGPGGRAALRRARRRRGEWLAAAAADEYGDAPDDDPFAPRVDCPSQVAADEALARRLAAEDERPADAGAQRAGAAEGRRLGARARAAAAARRRRRAERGAARVPGADGRATTSTR